MLNLGKFFSIGLIICLALAGVALAGADDADKLTPNERGWDAKDNGLVSAIGKDSLELTVPEIDYIGNYGGSLDTAVSQIGTARKRLLINQATTMANNLTIPATLQLGISRKGQINIPTTKTLTIKGGLEAGLYQIFSCAGTGTVAGLKTVYPEWFGAAADGTTDDTSALNKAFATGTNIVFQPGKTYYTPTLAAVSKSNVSVLLSGATLKTNSLSITGDNTVVDLGGGVIDGCLKYATIGTHVAAGSTAITVSSAAGFTTADHLQSSYGLGIDFSTDETTLVGITSVVGNTINVDTPTNNPGGILPVGSKVGNFSWNRTLNLIGNNLTVMNGRIINNAGVPIQIGLLTAAVGHKAVISNIKTDLSGKQNIFVYNQTGVVLNDVDFGQLLDNGKSTMGVAGTVDVIVNGGTWRPYNHDNLVIIGETANTNDISVVFNGTTLDCINGVLVDAPGGTHWSYNGCIAALNYGNLKKLEFNHCLIKNFRFGTITSLSADTGFTADRLVFNDCDVETGSELYYFHNTDGSDVPKQNFATNCRFKSLEDTPGATNYFYANGDFLNCRFDTCTFLWNSIFHSSVINCKFINCTSINFSSTATQEGNFFYQTPINIPVGGPPPNTPLSGGLVFIQNTDFPAAISSVVGVADHDCTRLRFQSVYGSQPWRVWHEGGTYTYAYDITCFYDYPKGLIGDDWLIPTYSLIHFLGDGSTKYVNKSKATKLAVAATASEVTITVADATGFANGEVINILCDDNRVHSTTIKGAPAGNVVTLTNVMPYAAAIGKGVCAYTVAP